MRRGSWARALLFVAAVIGLLLFTHATLQVLASVLLGAAVMVLGLLVYYRPVALAGLLIVTVTSAATMRIETLTEARTVITAVLGLLLPSSVLAWIAFSAESEEPIRFSPARRPFGISAAYLAACLLAVPVAVAVAGLLFRSLSARLEGLAEISIVLMVATVGAVLLGSLNPREPPASGQEGAAE